MSKRHGYVLGSGAGLGLALFFACSPNAGNNDAKLVPGGRGAAGAASLDASLGGSQGNNGGFQGFLGVDAAKRPKADGALTADSACGATVMEPEAIKVEKTVEQQIHCTATVPEPLAIYIMLDNSGSMSDDSKWTNAVAAITAFVNSDTTAHGAAWACVNDDGGVVPVPPDLAPPAPGAISVAIQYFHPQNVQNPNECDGTGHSTPAVPMAPLPSNASAIVASLGSTGPHRNTPTTGALTGGTEYCAAYEAAHPNEKCVLVLVTDGQPNGCGLTDSCPDGGSGCVDPNSASTLTPIAASAFKAANSVITFTVGMSGVTPNGFNLLNAIAIAGGSDCTPNSPGNEACDVTTGGSQAFLDALNTIRHTVQVTGTSTRTFTTTSTQTTTLSCEWAIPKPAAGETFDKGRVNVTFTTEGGSEKLGNVPGVAQCAAAGDGWYYDDPNTPTKIVTCPSTCTKLQAATDAKVQVLVGCVTEPAVFH